MNPHLRRTIVLTPVLVFFVFLAFLAGTPTAHGADPANPPPPGPAPASPSLLPPYAVWETAPVEGVGQVNGFDMAVDDDGTIHLAYGDATTGALVYMVGQPGWWITSTVEYTVSLRFIDPSIALDNSGSPHISYVGRYYVEPCMVSVLRSVRYAERQGGAWLTSDVTAPLPIPSPFPSYGCDVGMFAEKTQLILDGVGTPWITWTGGYRGPPKHSLDAPLSRRLDGEWQSVPLGAKTFSLSPPGTSLAVDPSGGVHAVYTGYRDASGSFPLVAWHTVWKGADALHSVVAGEAAAQDIAIDLLGRLYIALVSEELQMVQSSGAGWITETVETGFEGYPNYYLGYPVLQIGPDGLPAMALMPANGTTPVEIRIIWWDGSEWLNEGMGLAPNIWGGLAFDFVEGTPVIAYVDATSFALHLARRVPVEIEPRTWIPAVERQSPRSFAQVAASWVVRAVK